MIMSIAFGVLGFVLIILGIRILLTGKLTKNEEAKIASYSKKGARTYKLINVVLNIIVGLFLIGECIVDFLEFRKILDDSILLKVIMFGVIIIMVIVYFIVVAKCKKMTDDE
ncbi:MAG: hypothetical protein IJ932_05435 [Ruminococcus sp.]|nr:hypothetical protein [Ruminococcus sp.]